MSVQITVTEEEILSTPNYYEMGEKIHNKLWRAKRDQEGPQMEDEHFHMSIDENGLVTSINRPDEYDTCVMCGKKTPYLRGTHIDLRHGYVEGLGQLCSECHKM